MKVMVLIQRVFLCIGLYIGIGIVSLMLGCLMDVKNKLKDATTYAWLISLGGFILSLLYIIDNF